jgi:glycosyltransferase involved in cell wall biosynthesis
MRPIILCFVAYYLPGYRSGGPVRTIANIVHHLGAEYDIRIVTSDRDFLSEKPYPGVQIDSWNTFGNAQVYYASRFSLTFFGIIRILRETPHDFVYLNSFFSFWFASIPLFVRRLGLVPLKPVLIAPRGEFSPGALSIKKHKKLLHIFLSGFLGIYKNLYWQASSELEVNDIRFSLSRLGLRIHVAPDLPGDFVLKDTYVNTSVSRRPGPLRVVFLSRITPKKNLDYLLRALHGISSSIHLSIHGPIEDSYYWRFCLSLIENLPLNISAEYSGEVFPANIHSVLSSYDLFVFPTLGENFGHVILESLSAGTPVLISDQTPWRGDCNGGLEELPLCDIAAWQARLEVWARYDESILLSKRRAAILAAQCFLGDSSLLNSTRSLFLRVLESSSVIY